MSDSMLFLKTTPLWGVVYEVCGGILLTIHANAHESGGWWMIPHPKMQWGPVWLENDNILVSLLVLWSLATHNL